MKFLTLCKDGGPESTVWAYTLIEIKSLFSIILLRFENGSRGAYHSHAFNCISWVLRGELEEIHRKTRLTLFDGAPAICYAVDFHTPSLAPIITRRTTTHKVISIGRTWVLTFRGPWAKTWVEAIPDGHGGYQGVLLTQGRQELRQATGRYAP